jgi:hypothetical protein
VITSSAITWISRLDFRLSGNINLATAAQIVEIGLHLFEVNLPAPIHFHHATIALYLTPSLPARYHAWYCTAALFPLGL